MEELDKLETFLLLLFIHLARVDGSMHPNERDVILVRMGELFPQESQWASRLDDMDKVYAKLGHAHAEALLKEHLVKFEQTEATIKGTIHFALYDIINANGRVSEEETQVLQVFKPWLTSS